MNPIRAVLFDAGGTLIHLDAELILAALAEAGVPCDAASFAYAERAARATVSARMRAGERIDDRTRWRIYAQALLAGLGCDAAAARSVRAAVRAHGQAGRLFTRTVAGTAETLAELRAAGLVVGVISNSDGRVESFLETAGLRGALDFVIDSGTFGVEKPDPRIFAAGCARAGVSAAEAVYVGDVYEVDVLGARAAGLLPVLVDPDDLVPEADCARIPDVCALPAWLRTPRAA
ncbi:MAG TPA: HAD-IA family hydrolase [Longimicrobiales bacterium]|nr:HAD-IA family hydrolase [Longimicrobiales bacterium]